MIEDTNYRGEFSGAETAPIKVHYMNEGLIKGNYVKNSKGGNSAGIWTDWGNQNVRVTGNIVMNAPWGYYAEAVHGPILVDNNVFIGDNDIRMLDATGVVYANNLFLDSGRFAVDGGGRDNYYFQPGTMNETSAVNSVQKFFWFNNLVQGMTLPADATNKTHVKEGNATGALSNVRVAATNKDVKLDFTLTGGTGATPATKPGWGSSRWPTSRSRPTSRPTSSANRSAGSPGRSPRPGRAPTRSRCGPRRARPCRSRPRRRPTCRSTCRGAPTRRRPPPTRTGPTSLATPSTGTGPRAGRATQQRPERVGAGRPGRHLRRLAGGPSVGGGVREVVQAPDLRQR